MCWKNPVFLSTLCLTSEMRETSSHSLAALSTLKMPPGPIEKKMAEIYIV
jgi:hypothetical protein